MKVSSCVLGGILTLLGLCGTSCSTSDPTAPTASNSGKYYAVSVKQAEFYLYGPQQGNGPDRKLPHAYSPVIWLQQGSAHEWPARLCRQSGHSRRATTVGFGGDDADGPVNQP